MNTVNTITTSRLILRPLTILDAQSILDIIGDPDTAWWADIDPFWSLEKVVGFIDWGNRSGSVAQWAIAERRGGTVVGLIQAKDPWAFGNAPGVVELGYLLSPLARGNGYMTEAVRAICGHVFEDSVTKEVVLDILPDNKSSRGVAARCGFSFVPQREEQRSRRYLDGRLLDRFALTRDDYGRLAA